MYKLDNLTLPSPVQQLFDPLFDEKEVEVYIKREDLIHPEFGGNKYRKLKFNIQQAIDGGFDKVLTFGGAFSNHIYSSAAYCHLLGLECVGVIRGEEPQELSSTLNYAISKGMQIRWMDRKTYRVKKEETVIQELKKEHGDFYLVPEGGTNELAIRGVKEMVGELNDDYSHICCAAGTGGTIAGIISSRPPLTRVVGFSALKGDFLNREVSDLVPGYNNWHITDAYCQGGYAKINAGLVQFMGEFKKRHNVQLDPIYTSKMMMGIYDMISKDRFESSSKILAIHTGGLQGLEGMKDKIGKYEG